MGHILSENQRKDLGRGGGERGGEGGGGGDGGREGEKADAEFKYTSATDDEETFTSVLLCGAL